MHISLKLNFRRRKIRIISILIKSCNNGFRKYLSRIIICIDANDGIDCFNRIVSIELFKNSKKYLINKVVIERK
jgi:hypothetical protein